MTTRATPALRLVPPRTPYPAPTAAYTGTTPEYAAVLRTRAGPRLLK
ncbi:hypothetical protein [Streptomyces siamensis]